MKRISFIIVAALWLAACNNAEQDKKNADTLAGITAKSAKTSKNALSVSQKQIDDAMNVFEVIHLKSETVRSMPLWERASAIKKQCNETYTYLSGMKDVMPGQSPAEFERSKTELFRRIDETVNKIGSILNQEEKSNSRNYLFIDDKTSFNQANAVVLIDLLQIDLKVTELDAIRSVLGGVSN